MVNASESTLNLVKENMQKMLRCMDQNGEWAGLWRGENFLWRKCDNPGVSIIWFSYNTFFNVRSQLSQPDLDWNRQNSSNSDATWCK